MLKVLPFCTSAFYKTDLARVSHLRGLDLANSQKLWKQRKEEAVRMT